MNSNIIILNKDKTEFSVFSSKINSSRAVRNLGLGEVYI